MGTDNNISAYRHIIWVDVCGGYIMGVYIKGMMKPESCAQCPGYDNEWGRCGFTRKEVTIFKMDMNDCPMQSIDDEKVEKIIGEKIK